MKKIRINLTIFFRIYIIYGYLFRRLNKNEKCGLEDAWDRFQDLDGLGFIEFDEDDIVRDPFLIEIMKRYKENK